MRTTVNLDDDVLARLQEEAKERDLSFRETINIVVREGLDSAAQRRSGKTHFRVRPRAIGLKPGLRYDSVSQLIELGEGEETR